MGNIARRLGKILGEEELGSLIDIVGVGDSGSRFARLINPGAPAIPVITVRFDRERWLRRLTVEPAEDIPEKPVICDDVLISGATVCSAVAQLGLKPRLVAVGLSYNSKRARKRVDVPIVEALRYGRVGGGCPPMNSISRLTSDDGGEVLKNLSDKYFDGKAEELKAILGRI